MKVSKHKIIEDAERIARGEPVDLAALPAKKPRKKSPRRVLWKDSEKYLDKIPPFFDKMFEEVAEEYGPLYSCGCGGDHAFDEFYHVMLIPFLYDQFASDFRRYERVMRKIRQEDTEKKAKRKAAEK